MTNQTRKKSHLLLAHTHTAPWLGLDKIDMIWLTALVLQSFRLNTQTFPLSQFICLSHTHTRTHKEHRVVCFCWDFDKQQQWPLREARQHGCDHREWKRSQSEMSTVPVVLALTQNCQKRERKKVFACVSECVTVCVCVNLAVGGGFFVSMREKCITSRRGRREHKSIRETKLALFEIPISHSSGQITKRNHLT